MLRTLRNTAFLFRPGSYKSVRFPEHFTATLVGHHSARSANKLTYGLYSAGISDEQKREIVEGVRLPQEVVL